MTSRVALITGSTAGLGLDLAIRLAQQGHAVAVNGRDGQRVDTAVAAVREAVPDAQVEGVPADVSSSSEVDEMVEHIRDALGPIGMMVHAAVVRAEAPLLETTDDMWRQNIGPCLDGAFYCTRAALPDMKSQRWGRILYYGGISTELGMPGRAALIAAKNGLYGLAKAVAAEVGPFGVTVNAISPGVIEDDPDGMPESERTTKRRDMVQQRARLARFGSTREVNSAAMYLLSEDGGYVTAQRWSISGGMSTL